MLMTLISEAKAFDVVSYERNSHTGVLTEVKTHYTESQAWMLQQRAINLLLDWIVINAQKKGNLSTAQLQFEEACMRMSRFGSKSKAPGQSYCANRLKMDNFMAEGVRRLYDQDADLIRESYKKNSALLGRKKDIFCARKGYYGRDYIPGGVAKYTGEGE
ncbi:hypothetical protein D3C81_1521930 [compost metagenome]